MTLDYVAGFCILSFLAGSLMTMILFSVLDNRLDKRHQEAMREMGSRR